ncbi:MAG TPA: hypothetical protein VJS92_07985 [Candidatus Polarisedimenticolaceae bacterium]|nr:hypothetical protein [Candidatus Polarisedimenticolaceae bacterium]
MRPNLAGVLIVLASAGPAHAVIQGNSWFPIGPAPSCCFFPGGEAGRATSVAANPANFTELWIGTAGGGLWRSSDDAQTWTPMTDGQASLAIGAVALADCDSAGCLHVYAGTGENAIRRDTYYGRGLLVGTRISIFGDMQWELRTGAPYSFSQGSIYNVVLDPNSPADSRVIYVTLSSGETASASESTVTAPEPFFLMGGGYGIYKSTNNGQTWAHLNVAGAIGERPTDLEMDRTNSAILYAGFLGKGIFKTTNGGTLWCPLNPGFSLPAGCPATSGLPDPNAVAFDHVEIATDPASASHLYATFGMCPDRLVADCTPSVYESTNAGLSWTLQFQGSSISSPGVPCPGGYTRYTHALTVYPADSGTLYLGGVRLCKSTDHGQTWSSFDDNVFGRTIHFDHHAVLFDAVGFRGYDVNDGGIATWQFPSSTWTPRNDGIQTTGFQAIATSPLTARVIGGAQDNSGMMWVGARQWSHLPCCGDGGFSVMDSDDFMKMYITTNAGDLDDITVVPMKSASGGAIFSEASSGIPDDEPRSFYPPMVQDPSGQHPLYFGTNRLWKSTDDAASWTAVSPVLSTTPSSEIFSGVDAITAIAVAPSDPNWIYLGYYSGKVFVTASACDQPSCWFEMDLNLPAAPITSLAVHPTNKEILVATLSGFFSGSHVYWKSPQTVQWFPTGSISELNGVPASTIAYEPDAPSRLWLGTDKGVYKSLNSGGSWFKFGAGLPNAAVYQIAIDRDRQRVFAATHGRGAFLLTGPHLDVYEGCSSNFVWDLPVYGGGFDPNHGCTMKLLRQDSSVCASGPLDAIQGTIATDAQGVLATWKSGQWADSPVVWACLHGKCLGNANVSACNVPNNPLSTVVAICNNQVAFAQVPGCPALSKPPSSWLSLTGQSGGFFAQDSAASMERELAPNASLASSVDPELSGSGSFRLIPTVQSGDGSSHTLCSVNVGYLPSETMTQVLEHARDAVNADPGCVSAGVSAAVMPAAVENEVEDLFPHPGNLVLVAPALTGGQLIAAVEKDPGPINGPCFDLGQLGVPVASQVRRMKVAFETNATGAMGGDVTLKETSSLGECTITVPTHPGDTSDTIATAFENAFQAPSGPGGGGSLACPSSHNPHDVKRQAGGLILVMSTGIQVCLNDPGVGVTLAPAEICAGDADCNDGNPCTHDACNVTTGQCQSTPEPNFLPCDDGDACTVGNLCINGACGTPLSCDDGIACTEDRCDPSNGRCSNPPVVCDDGNPCTNDVCLATTGHCSSSPTIGAPCDDGNLCTSGDVCDVPPGTTTPVCRGVDACADADGCTADQCDPATGACLHTPIQCDDGDACTSDSCDPATGQCNAVPLSCDDGNPCTADSCHAAGCTHVPIATAEPAPVKFSSKTTLFWPASAGASHWNTYRGTVPSLYNHTCFESADAGGNGPTTSVDPAIPPPGGRFYYLISGEGACGESALGHASSGATIPNTSPCPTPP